MFNDILQQDIINIKSIRFDTDGFSILRNQVKKEDFDANTVIEIVEAHRPPVIVPKEIYVEENKHQYLKLQFNNEEIKEVFTEFLGDYVIIYYFTDEEYQALSQWENYSLVHLWSFLSRGAHKSKDMLFFDLCHNNLQCYLVKDDQLVLATSFNVLDTSIDTLYYLTYITKEKAVQSTSLTVQTTRCDSSVLSQLQPYFNVKLCEL